MIEFTLMNMEDLQSDGKAKVWVFSKDSKPNKEYFCKNLFNVVDAEELYDLLFCSQNCKMTKSSFSEFFTEVLR